MGQLEQSFQICPPAFLAQTCLLKRRAPKNSLLQLKLQKCSTFIKTTNFTTTINVQHHTLKCPITILPSI